MKYIIGLFIGILSTLTIGSIYLSGNVDRHMRQLKFIVKHGYFTGCVDGLVATSPFQKTDIIEACGNATDAYSAPVDELIDTI